jgi:hypothetical protein
MDPDLLVAKQDYEKLERTHLKVIYIYFQIISACSCAGATSRQVFVKVWRQGRNW